MTRFLIPLLALVLPAHADAVLTFDDAVQIAAQHNADLRNARANLVAAEQRARVAYSGYLPQLSGSVGYTDDNTAGGSYSSAVTASQNLFSGFQDEARVQQGAANVESAQAALDLAKAQLSRDLKLAYVGLLYAQDNVALTESILRRLEENLRLVELRFESGRENRGSFLFTRAQAAQARLDNLQARQAVVSAQAQLARALGQNNASLRVTGTAPVTDPLAIANFAELARNTPDNRDAVAREKAAAADVRLARAGFYPSISVSGSIGREGERWYPNADRNTVSASISIPLFTGGADVYGTRAALAALDATRASHDSVEQLALVRLQQTYAAYVESVEKLRVDRDFLEAAETRAGIARARYQNGLITFEDWDRIENDLIQRQKVYLASQRDRVTAEAAWELAQGVGVIP